MHHVIGVSDTTYGTWSYQCIRFFRLWNVNYDHNAILLKAQLVIEWNKHGVQCTHKLFNEEYQHLCFFSVFSD